MDISEKTSSRRWSPRDLWTPVMTQLIGLMICKLLLFDVLWCMETSWNTLLDIRLYANAILLAFILSVPIGMFRYRWLQLAILLATDIWCLCILFNGGGNLSHLPILGWLLTDTLPEMKAGGADPFLWYNLLLPLTTLMAFMSCLKYSGRTVVPIQGKMQYCGYLLLWSVIAYLLA